VWLATGAAGAVAGITAAVMAVGSAPAMAAYSVTQHGGTVSVSVDNASGVAGANAPCVSCAPRSWSPRCVSLPSVPVRGQL